MDSATRHILALSRRGALRGGLGLAALAALQPAAARRAWAQPRFASDPFTLGIASGDPWPDGVVLWTRLAPEPLAPGGGMPKLAVPVRWSVAEDAAMQRVVQQGEALARPELGHAVHVELSGLRPGRPYWYRFQAGEALSRIGRTRTAPAADAAPAALRFVNAGCQNYEQGHFTAWRHVAEEEGLDFVFHYGDYIYEGGARGGQPRRHNSAETYSLDEYRARYALYKLDPDLATAQAAHPFLHAFDDHEVDNNWAGEFSEEDGSRAGHPAVPPEIFALRKQAAFQAWYEHMPLRRAQLPRGPSIQAWRGLRFGGLLEVAVLDTRSGRTDQPCGDTTAAPCEGWPDPAARMMDPAQEAWLLDRLRPGRARWQLLAHQVPILQRDFGGPGAPRWAMDKWDGYPAARERLLAHVEAAKLPGLLAISGDVHAAWAGTLHRDAAGPEGPALGCEFTATSISSGGDGSEQLSSTPRVMAQNPHLGFFNNRRGYTLHELGPDRMTARFRALAEVTRPGAAREDRGALVVEHGASRLLPG
ncbi:alkaline phosphatase [Pseudoroseomonas cervicalis]|uniref:alkaline phosphatase D family protein n=1 Tax=Teichococcus cervicalis TaxID=204525 RepID=UPI0022F17EC9|nr:alkaline phosphatase D family protein [Pseudoroseomonas cervicalis]WBV41824.1 alkaline phosphatase D family protein [Pseudoroseomonas cervicalis]